MTDLAVETTPSPDGTGEWLCERCGRSITRESEVISRHTTSEGVVVYRRCACGLLHVSLYGKERRVASGARSTHPTRSRAWPL